LSKVKLFELGDPAFMLAIVRYLRPIIYMASDFILRRGEYSENMCFIRSGKVEILASDDLTPIAYLEEGAYFGEIGIVFDMKRSASVRAMTVCVISAIAKQEILTILKNFPDHFEFL